MNIYVCGAISGGRKMLPIYRAMIDFLKHYGTVLTDHIADPTLTETGEKNLSDKDIFKRDFTWLQKADCIVAEVTTPSLGVGYEIAVGVQRHIPVYAFFQINQHQKLSALIQGNPSIHVLLYTHCDDLLAKLELVMTSWNNTKKRP